MLKRLARVSVAGGLRILGMLRMAERKNAGRLVILCYHRVLPTKQKHEYAFPDLVVTPEAFRGHLETLTRHYHVLPLCEAVRKWRAGGTDSPGSTDPQDSVGSPGNVDSQGSVDSQGNVDSRPQAAITFDDGYRDNIEFAVPLLQEFNARATFFVVVGLIGSEQMPWFDRVAHAVYNAADDRQLQTILAECTGDRLGSLNGIGVGDRALSARQLVSLAKTWDPARRRILMERMAELGQHAWSPDRRDVIMDWSDLKSLTANGHEIGSHTMTHEILTQLDDEALGQEVIESHRILETELGCPVTSFCYPNGDVDERVEKVVRTAGYEVAVGTVSGTNNATTNAFRLHRHFIHQERLSGVAGKPSGALLRSQLADMTLGRFLRPPRGATT